MKKEPILLIMAAGMGSRYGSLKQIDPIGPRGEILLDYNVYDAWKAGFRRVIFLIKHEIEADFRSALGKRVEAHMEVRYAFQELDRLPAPFAVPAGRTKPWGTGHAVLCCRELIDAPFAAINADDCYGASAFRSAYDFLCGETAPDHCMMVSYLLRNTLSPSGHVSRGVCRVNAQGLLEGIDETTHIISTCDGPLYTSDGESYRRLPPDTPVSMNLWGFHPAFLDELAAGFPAFLETEAARNPLKAEYYLPAAVDAMLKRGGARASVLPSHDQWYGVTYQADKPLVMEAVRRLYPDPLWGQVNA